MNEHAISNFISTDSCSAENHYKSTSIVLVVGLTHQQGIHHKKKSPLTSNNRPVNPQTSL